MSNKGKIIFEYEIKDDEISLQVDESSLMEGKSLTELPHPLDVSSLWASIAKSAIKRQVEVAEVIYVAGKTYSKFSGLDDEEKEEMFKELKTRH